MNSDIIFGKVDCCIKERTVSRGSTGCSSTGDSRLIAREIVA
ncbi:hypothetical protein MKY59_26695 [Paenibacillus sp. FSL W8-0426]